MKSLASWTARIRPGLRAKEILAVSLLTLLVVATLSIAHLMLLTHVVIQDVDRHGQMIARQIYAQSARVLARGGGDPLAALRDDRDLQALVEASAEYSPQLLYAAVTDSRDRVVLDSDRRKVGEVLPPRPRLKTLVDLDGWRRVRALFGEPQIYEVALPLTLDGRPFASVRIGVALPFVKGQLVDSLRHSAALGGLALLAAWGVAVGLSRLALRPIRRLAQAMERLRAGELDTGLAAGGRGDFGALALQFHLLGQTIQADRSRTLAERAGYQHAMDQLDDPLIFCDAGRRVLFVNRAAEPVLGRPVGEVAGAVLDDVLDGAHPLRVLVDRALTSGAEVRNASVRVDLEGETVEYLASVFVVGAGGEACDGALALLKDTRALAVSARSLQSLVRYAARLTALGRATSEMAHEVKNPLNALTIHLRILRDKMDAGAGPAVRSLDVMRAEIGRLDAIVDRFREAVRSEGVARAPVDLSAVLRDVAALLEVEWKDKGVVFSLALDPSLPAVSGDEELLRTALLNIVLNACQAMNGRGTVTITAERDGREHVRVIVADTGAGIPAGDMDKIFAPSFTTKVGGSGLGLPLVRRIVEMHDGDVEVVSREGQGTTVLVRLPARR